MKYGLKIAPQAAKKRQFQAPNLTLVHPGPIYFIKSPR